jgi:hypothetical protein
MARHSNSASRVTKSHATRYNYDHATAPDHPGDRHETRPVPN